MASDDLSAPMQAVEVRRDRIDENGVEIDGWVARHGETEAVGHGREEALRRLVVAAASDAESGDAPRYEDVPSYEVGLVIAIGWFACIMLMLLVGSVASSFTLAFDSAIGAGVVMSVVLVVQKWRDGGFADAE